jgi:thymidylate kinase
MSLTAGTVPLRTGLSVAIEPIPAPAGLVAQVSDALEAAGIPYCQWKGHGKRERWSAGLGDLDLLVDRTAASRFGIALERLGFKLAIPAPDLQVPGVISYLGLDAGLGRLVHVHAHFHLVIGSAWRRHYHLPIETAILNASVTRAPFRTPSPEHELLLFVLHQVLRHDLRGALRSGEPVWLRQIEPELHRLESTADPRRVAAELRRLLPDVSHRLFLRCLESLRPGCPATTRIAARGALEWRLRTYLRRPPLASLAARAVRPMLRAGLRNGWRWLPGKHLAAGGSVIALVGADGAGKSTCATSLVQWLGAELQTRRVHLGRPPRRLLTYLTGGALKFARRYDERRRRAEPSLLVHHLELARHVCTARDRYLLYRRVRRFAAQGGLAICERYPIPESHALAGPSAAQGLATAAQSRLAGWLREVETTYYARIGTPDLLVVLQIDPDAAVARKTDEPADYVLARARLLWDVDWSNASAQVVDAGRPLEEVVAELRFHLWENL